MVRALVSGLCVGAALVSCSVDSAGVCGGEAPIQLWEGSASVPFFGFSSLGERTIAHVSAADTRATLVVEPCGAGAVVVDAERWLGPVVGLPAPEAPGKTMMCGLGDPDPIVEVDLSGETAAKEILTAWACPFVTEFGAFAGLRATARGDLRDVWWLPAFPAEAGAVPLAGGAFYGDFRRVADTVFFFDSDANALHAFDLESGSDAVRATGVVGFEASATHVLWYGGETALLDVAADAEVALVAPSGFATWRFTPSGAYVLRLPTPTDMTPEDVVASAYDLGGVPATMPGSGQVYDVFPDDGLLMIRGDRRLGYGEIGQSVTTWLGYPPIVAEDAGVVDGRVEVLETSGVLWGVPLDGSPASVAASGVGTLRAYLDEARLITIFEGELVFVRVGTAERTALATNVGTFVIGADGGVYYTRGGGADDGVWYLPAAALPPP